ncbi:phosphatidylinositol-specific phospholipase C/glycerophosphodiester phosphodiesterase family protein [Paenibacillus filicis]|uniref:Phosphatidylinositol-specific phospholipase C/glycerophosphodiester phosphodiesterase family protein n=2 Tax=Paenibacillus filicis TaxID=669464 RepID=A0ABU9DLQ6_9BACL
MKTWGLVSLALSLLLGLSSVPAHAQDSWTRYRYIAHGMGQIDGVDISNSREAFITNYERGFRVFEADLILTTDDQLVARHDWSDYLTKKLRQPLASEKMIDSPMSLEQFKARLILNRYHPMDVSELLSLLKDYPEAYLITDTKETDSRLVEKQFRLLVNAAKSVDPDLLNRIVPELYTPEMIRQVRSIYPFPSFLFSLYLSSLSHDEVLKEVRTLGVQALAMPFERAEAGWISSLKAAGAVVYTHTVNEPKEWERLRDMGVHGVYTDQSAPIGRKTAVSLPLSDMLTRYETEPTDGSQSPTLMPIPQQQNAPWMTWLLDKMKDWLQSGRSSA